MAKIKKIWVAEGVLDDRRENSRTLKGLCGLIGMGYTTAGRRKKEMEESGADKMIWTISDSVWKVTREDVKP